MKHLTPEELEIFAAGESPAVEGAVPPDGDASVRHLAACARCREEVEAVRAISRTLADLPQVSPRRPLADEVLARVDLPVPWLEAALERLPDAAPSEGFAGGVLERVDLPAPWLERALQRLPAVAPNPGFATAVMSRVRLPVPWRERLGAFARRRKVALAGAATASVAISGAAAGWLFGVQGVTPLQVVGFVFGGVRDLALQGLVALGGLGYELGLLDAGTALTDISPTTALSGLGIASALGLLSLLVMTRLWRVGPELRLRESA